MRLRDAASKKILVEVALLKAIEARNAVSIDTVLKQLQTLRDGSGGETAATREAASTSPASQPTRAPKATRVEAQEPAEPMFVAAEGGAPPAPYEPAEPQPTSPAAMATTPASNDLEDLWTQLLEAVGRASPFARTYLLEAHPVSLAKNLFTIGFDPEFEDHMGLVDNPRNHALLQTKLSELGHPGTQIKFIKAEAPPHRVRATVPQVAEPASVPEPTPRPAAQTPVPTARSAATPPSQKDKPASVLLSKEDFKNDPLIQKALEIFKGQIVEVRA